MLDNPIRLIRELKGAPLSIFFALAYQRTRVSQGWLAGATGYTDKPVQQALAYMQEIGLVNHTSSGWQLTRGNAVQLPLPMEQIEASSEPAEVISEQPAGDNSDENGGSRNNSDSGPLVSLVNIDSNINDLTKLTNSEEIRKNSDSEAVWDILESIGVRKNKTTEQIAALDWVDSEYLRGMVEKLEGEGRTWPKDCGLLLYRLRQKPKTRHGRNCACEDCDEKRRMRYLERAT